MLYIRPLRSWIHLPLTLSIIMSKGTIRLRAASIGSLANNSSACSLVLGKPMNAQSELLVTMCHILTKNSLVSIAVFTDYNSLGEV